MSNDLDPRKNNTTRFDFWLFIKNGSISTLSLFPPITGGLLVFIWAIAKSQYFPAIPQIYNYIIVSVASIIVGTLGLIYVYRKEMPGPVSSVTIKGGFAVVVGYITLFFFWSMGIAGIIFALTE